MGGSMHLLDIEHGLYGTVPIVGATIPIATGAALSAKMDRRAAVAVSFLGDGATEEGVFHESLNFAAIHSLPVVYIVENNLFASHLHISQRQPYDSICRFAEANGIPWQRVDGNNVVSVRRAAEIAFCAARAGNGPQLIEAVTYRWRGHVGHREDNDVGVMRKENLVPWKKRDPIDRLVISLEKSSAITESQIRCLWSEQRAAVDAAWEQAVDDPYPSENALLDRVYFVP